MPWPAPRPGAAEAPRKVADFAKEQADPGKGEGKGGGVAQNREKYEADKLNKTPEPSEGAGVPKDDAVRRLAERPANLALFLRALRSKE